MRPVLVLLVLAAAPSLGETSPAVSKALDAVTHPYRKARFERALKQVERARAAAQTAEDQRTCDLYEGTVLAAMGREEDAKALFEKVLIADPNAELPAMASRKVTSLFARIRDRMSRPEPEAAPEAEPAPAETKPAPPPSPAPRAPGARPRIALVPVRVQPGVSPGVAKRLADVLATDLQQSGKYEVMSVSDELLEKASACSEEGCLAEVGKMLGADDLLEPSIGTAGNMRILALRLIDVGQGTAKARESETLPDDNAVADAGHRLIAKLLGLPPPRIKSSGRRAAGIAVLVGAGLSAAGGGVLFGLAESDVSRVRTSPNDPSLRNNAVGMARGADAFFGVAIVAAGVAVFMIASGGSGS